MQKQIGMIKNKIAITPEAIKLIIILFIKKCGKCKTRSNGTNCVCVCAKTGRGLWEWDKGDTHITGRNLNFNAYNRHA